VAVKILAGPVITHRRARIGVTGSDLDVAQVHPSIEHGRDERYGGAYVDEPMVVGMPAVSASRRRRRVAAWRSIRAPRLLSRIGPRVRASVARSMARPTAGGSGTRTTLVPLPHTRSTRCRALRRDR
jgi:hypothetical protein